VLLQQLANSRRAASNPNLPESIRAKFRKARDHAELALGLDAALKRKLQRERSKPPTDR
jgi:hypothetical protein